jgi:hypothetical protein
MMTIYRRIVLIVAFAIAMFTGQVSAEDEQSGNLDDYNQWKKALGVNQATDPRSIIAPPGFVVELLRSAEPAEGSWISLAFDPTGALIVAREDRGLLRFTFATSTEADGRLNEKPETNPNTRKAISRVETVNDTLLECRGLLWAYDSLYVNANNSKGLYRLRYGESNQFSEPELLRTTPGNVGHGRNDLALGP